MKLTAAKVEKLNLEEIEFMKKFNFTTEHIHSVVSLTKSWHEYNFLEGVSPFVRLNLAVLLDTLKNIKDKNSTDENQKSNFLGKIFERLAIPVARRVFDSNFLGYELVSVQAISTPVSLFYCVDVNGKMISKEMVARSRQVAVNIDLPECENVDHYKLKYKDNFYAMNLDAEMAFCSDLQIYFKNLFESEIVRDLKYVCRTTECEYQDKDQLFSLIEGLSAYVAINCKKDANWIVATPDVIKLISDKVEFIEKDKNENQYFNFVGIYDGKYKLFEDRFSESGEVLMGFKDHENPYHSGYFYCPFVIYNCPLNWEKGSIMSRYGKVLIENGFYGCVKIKNIPVDTPVVTAKEEE